MRIPAPLITGLTALLLAAPAEAQSVPNGTVIPLLTCITVDPQTRLLTAQFGYRNSSSNPGIVTINVTPDDNIFVGGEVNPFVGQPTVFVPGTFQNVFSATFDLNEAPSYAWALNGAILTIRDDPTQYCPPPPPRTLACRDLESVSTTPTAEVACAAGETVTGGGGACDNSLGTFPSAWNTGQMQSSRSASVGGAPGWRVTCRIGNATASASCCKLQ